MEWCGYKWECCMEGGRLVQPEFPWMWYCDKCSYVDEDNTLHMWIEKRPKRIKYWDGRVFDSEMAVGLLRSKTPFSYGTFSADIILPKGKNLWPAMWTTGDKSWPPEIDIIEAWTDERGRYFRWTTPQFPYLVPSWKTTTNVHYNIYGDDGSRVHTETGSRNIPYTKQCKDPSESFVNYGCEWLPDSIKFYANGKLVRSIGKDVARKLTENNTDQDFRMDVVFDLCCDNPDENVVEIDTEMLVKNFTYTPLK